MTAPSTKIWKWTRDGFFISTDPSLVSLEALNKAFDSDELNWAKPLDLPFLQLMLSNSFSFGVYTSSQPSSSTLTQTPPQMIGFARVITDHCTLAYLTDVYIIPQYQSLGLGSWLIDCVKEWVDSMPHLRTLVLVTKEGRNEKFYGEKLGAGRLEGVGHRLVRWKGPGSVLGAGGKREKST